MPSTAVLVVIVIVAFYIFSSIKILKEYERGVIFRLGRLLSSPKGPGIALVFRPVRSDRAHLPAPGSNGSSRAGHHHPR